MFWFGVLSLERVLGVRPAWNERKAFRVAALVASVAGLLWPAVETAVVLGDPAAALNLRQIGFVMSQTSFGQIWSARLAIVLGATILAWLPTERDAVWQERGVYVLVAAALASVAMVGHAAAASGLPGIVQRLTAALHLLVAGAWIGALPVLYSFVARLRPHVLAELLRRFSAYGQALVATVVATGLLNAWFRIGGVAALIKADYAHVLIGKVALVAGMGLAALLNRGRYMPALDSRDPQAQWEAERGLRLSIALEFALGVAVVVVAFLLGVMDAPH